MTELNARLDHGVPLTVVDGIEVADTDAADATMAEAKARIEALEASLASSEDERGKMATTAVVAVGEASDKLAAAEARCKRLEAQVEQAFRDGLAYATIVDVTDADEAWRTSRARLAQEPKP